MLRRSIISKTLHVGVLLEARYLGQNQPGGLINSLEGRGHFVDRILVDETACEIGTSAWLETFDLFDLIVARGRGWLTLSLLRCLEFHQIPTINRSKGIAAVYNKVEMGQNLSLAGLSVPRSYVGSVAQLVRLVPALRYPLILKPVFGDNCLGLRCVYDPEELMQVEWSEPIVLAQDYLPTDGYDLKLYGIGRDVWAVRKPSPFNPGLAKSKPELVAVTPELKALAWKCADLFGLDLYGVDCIETENGPVVIEVNEFPNYTAVPDVNDRLADFVTLNPKMEVTQFSGCAWRSKRT